MALHVAYGTWGTLCLSCAGQSKISAAQLEELWYLEIQVFYNFSSSNWNHNIQPRSTAFIVGGIGAANQERGPNILGTTQKEIKLSVPHVTHCFKGLSEAESYSGIRQGVNKPSIASWGSS